MKSKFYSNFGFFNEAMLQKKNSNLIIKLLIGQLVKLFNERGIDPQNATRANRYEASQLETNQSLQNREIFFSLIFLKIGEWNFHSQKMKDLKTIMKVLPSIYILKMKLLERYGCM